MSAKILDWKTGTGQTVDATSSQIIAISAIPDNSVVTLMITLVGRTAAGDVCVGIEQATAKRQAGALTMVTTNSIVPFNSASSAALNGVTMTVDVDTDAITVGANGVAGQTVNWMGSAQIVAYQN